MRDALAALEAFAVRAAEIFDRVEAAAAIEEARLTALDGRLAAASARIEAARGGTTPLVVRSARSLSQRTARAAGASSRGDAASTARARALRRPLGVLATPGALAPLPEALPEATVGALAAAWGPPAADEAAAELSRVARSVAATAVEDGVRGVAVEGGNGLLPPQERMDSVADLFLFNSGVIPYGSTKQLPDNLGDLFGVARDRLPSAGSPPVAAYEGRDARSTWLLLDQDAPDPLREDLRFRPRPAAEFALDLPDVLPELVGPVAALTWRQSNQHVPEMQRPAWDAPPPLAFAASTTAYSSRRALPASGGAAGGSARTSIARAPPPPPPRPKAAATTATTAAPLAIAPAAASPATPSVAPAAAPVAAPAEAEESGQRRARAPAPPSGKGEGTGDGKGKGKGKGNGNAGSPPPPPPNKAIGKAKGKGKAAPPPPPKKQHGEGKTTAPVPPPPKAKSGAGMDQIFAAIAKGGASLRKVAPPKERHGGSVGRVV